MSVNTFLRWEINIQNKTEMFSGETACAHMRRPLPVFLKSEKKGGKNEKQAPAASSHSVCSLMIISCRYAAARLPPPSPLPSLPFYLVLV